MEPKIIAPLAKIENLEKISDTGIDAIYFGLKNLSARPNEFSFGIEELEVINKIKELPIKGYAALNGEFPDYNKSEEFIIDILEKLQYYNCDGVIMGDYNLLEIYRERGFKIPLHMSTLLGIYNSTGTKWVINRYKPSRVILSTNLFIDEINSIIRDNNQIDYEIIIQNGVCFNCANRCFLHDLHDFTEFNSLSDETYGNRFWCSESYKIVPNNQLKENIWIGSPYIELSGLIPLFLLIGITYFKIEGRTLSLERIIKNIKFYKNILQNLKESKKTKVYWKYLIHLGEIKRRLLDLNPDLRKYIHLEE